MPQEAGLEEAGSQDAGSDSGGGANDAAAEAQAPCNTSADCTPTNLTHQQVACSPDTHTCVQLTTDECAVSPIGDFTYKSGIAPIFIGAFATIPNGGSPTSDVSYLNYQFAISEFATGIPAGPQFAKRMPVAVVCNNNPSTVQTALNHLVNDVHVAALVTAFDNVTLANTFSAYGVNTSANLFVINPFGYDSSLNGITQRGNQLWHMLGAPGDVASAYQALLPRLETYMRNNVPWKTSLGPSSAPVRPLRVATVIGGNATVLNDLAAAVTSTITWNNGQTVAQNGTAYRREALSGSLLIPGDTIQDLQASISNVVSDLKSFQPDVVISFASDEFVNVVEQFDGSNTGLPPIYVVSPYNTSQQSDLLASWIGVGSSYSETNRRRLFGVNVASSTDTSVLDAYDTNFVTIGMNPASALGAENYYDAMYFALYSLVAAGGPSTPLTGPQVGAGMARLISPSGTSFSMGTADMGNVFAALTQSTSATVYLDGTLGPPVFSPTTGARSTQGDIYCATANQGTADGGAPSTVFSFDQMRLTPSADGGPPSLTGTPCTPGF